MKKTLIILSLFTQIIFSQERVSVEKNQFKLNVLLPGVVYEHGFSTKNTLYSEFSFGVGYKSNSFYGNSWLFYPTINEQFRHYYNLEKRSLVGKSVTSNSGNFYALNMIYNFKSIVTNKNVLQDDASFTVGPVWGLQRTYNSGFNLSLNGGIGYNLEDKEANIVPIINFTLGWVIGK